MKSIHYLVFTGTAILLWATLAVLVSRLNHLPPLFLLGVTLVIGGSLSIFRFRQWQFDWRLLTFGVCGIFGYHFLLIMALRLADPLEANLINYLWPLLIVLLAPVLLSGFHLTMRHLLGASMGFCGVYILVAGSQSLNLSSQNTLGYLMALLAAFVWASYSLLSKRWHLMRTATVGLFCLISGGIALLLHFVMEPSVTIQLSDNAYLLALGLGPMGGAFFAWDAALKRGDPGIIGTLSYLTPMLSTGLLLVFGERTFEIHLLFALAFIIGGAFVSSYRPKFAT